MDDEGVRLGYFTPIVSLDTPLKALSTLMDGPAADRRRVKPDNRGRFGRSRTQRTSEDALLPSHIFSLEQVPTEADLIGRPIVLDRSKSYRHRN